MIYRHKKKGGLYKVISDNAKCKTDAYDGVRLVVYRRIDHGCHQLFVRDYQEFMDKFEESK